MCEIWVRPTPFTAFIAPAELPSFLRVVQISLTHPHVEHALTSATRLCLFSFFHQAAFVSAQASGPAVVAREPAAPRTRMSHLLKAQGL